MNDLERKKKAKEFSEIWKDRGYEKGDSQSFWLSLLRDVYGIEKPECYISFEDQVHIDHTAFIDGYIDETHVMIEQKSIDKSLTSPIKQSDGSLLTPFQQAKRYSTELPYSKRPRWIITSNFKEFFIYDMEKPNGDPEILLLSDLSKEYYRLDFLVDLKDEKIQKEMELSFKAGDLVAELYSVLAKQYENIETDENEQKSLNKLIVRIVFCLYAEDALLFGKKDMFHDYLNDYSAAETRDALVKLFKILDQKVEDRDRYADEKLLAFPYVNGGLFSDENIIIPRITDEIRNLILSKASDNFDWSGISPTIFGAVFESTLNPETRRKGGMHYTSIENIHKVIDPLFLDDLKDELNKIKLLKQPATILKRVNEYQDKLASLKFLDPACGSGNFLTETYICIRRLENEALKLHFGIATTILNPIKVSIAQFFGIEINDFAVTVAKTALWIAENQMKKETEDILSIPLPYLPLQTNAYISEGNALTYDWNVDIYREEISYIMGNPPFIGHQNRTDEQISDMKKAFYDLEKHGKLDYVCAWYNKAADYMKGTKIECAFVSTNSICQGESVPILWSHLNDKGVEIQFAHESFIWNNEANDVAHVHCVIIGFTCYKKDKEKTLYDNDLITKGEHINGYLSFAPDVFLPSRGSNLSGLPAMTKGSQPTDGGNLLLSKEEKDELIKSYPEAKELIKRFIGAQEFINNEERYCLWLKDVEPSKYRNIKPIMDRLARVSDMRKNSPTASVQRDANTPMLFTQIRQPDGDYLVVPSTSSENRKYIPIGYETKDVICGNSNMMIPNVSLYMFGVLTSNVHMAWMRAVAGRLEMRYRYEPTVYNCFPWPKIDNAQKEVIARCAKNILDIRNKYPNSSLADLYDELTMPPDLRTAHQENDKEVMKAYDFLKKVGNKYFWFSESETIEKLFELYKEIEK